MSRSWCLPLLVLFAACGETALHPYTAPTDAARPDLARPDLARPDFVPPDAAARPDLAPTPSGVPTYPGDNWGGKVGKRFPNLSFEGVASAATADAPTVIHVADYFDPAGARYDLLHVVIVAMWCPHCDRQASAIAGLADWQAQNRIATFELAIDGPNHSGPSMAEVADWAVAHKLSTPVARDPKSAQIKPYITVDYIPLHLLVNPRTMTILDATTGEVADLKAYEQKFRSQVTGG